MTRVVTRSVAALVVLALLLFVPTGRIDWRRGWLFLAVLVTMVGASAACLRRTNPEIFAARSRIHPGTKRWDRMLLRLLVPVLLAIVAIAALDDGRYQWSRMSWWFVGVGYTLLTVGTAITAWAQALGPERGAKKAGEALQRSHRNGML